MKNIKKYEAPSFKVTEIKTEDVIMASLEEIDKTKLLTGGHGKIKYVEID